MWRTLQCCKEAHANQHRNRHNAAEHCLLGGTHVGRVTGAANAAVTVARLVFSGPVSRLRFGADAKIHHDWPINNADNLFL
eukprot:COSAG01_NODE_15610_length_1319_cov_432.865574_1_plen_81_part_00